MGMARMNIPQELTGDVRVYRRGYGWRCLTHIIAEYLPYEDHCAARESLGDDISWVVPRRYKAFLYTLPTRRLNELSMLYE